MTTETLLCDAPDTTLLSESVPKLEPAPVPVACDASPPEELFHTLTAFRGVIDASPDLIFIKDVRSVYWACNPSFEAFAGRSEMAQIGHSDFDFFDRHTAEFFRSRDKAVMDSGQAQRNEEWVTYPDGRRALLDTLKSPIRDTNGKVIGLIGISRDITEDRQRDRSYRILIETSQDGFWRADMSGRLLEVNDAYVKSSGYSREELLSMRINDLDAEENPDETARRIERIIRTGGDLFETRHRRKDGSLWQVEISTSFVDLDGGTMFVFCRDVNERRRAEQIEKVHLQLGEIAINGTVDSLLRHALEHAELLTRSTISFFHLVDPDQESLTLQTWSKNTLRAMEANTRGAAKKTKQDNKLGAQGKPHPFADFGPWIDSIRDRRTLLINDYPAYLSAHDQPECPLAVTRTVTVPIFDANKQIVAVIGVGNRTNSYLAEDEEVLCAIGQMTMEMVERRSNADRVRLTSSVFDSTQDGIIITDARMAVIAVNQAFTRITNFTQGEMLGCDPRILMGTQYDEAFYRDVSVTLRKHGYWQGEIGCRNKAGEPFTVLLTLNKILDKDGQVSNYLAVFADLSEKKAAEARAEYLARVDSLTGLPNRTTFETTLGQTVAKAKRRERSVGLLLVGLDRFKDVNESFGHTVGDEVLRMAAERLQERLRHEDTLARLGGDEFAVMIEEVDRADRVAYVAQQLIDSLASPFIVGNTEVYVGASVGLSLFPLDAADAHGLLRNVDSALKLAKTQGRGVYRFYTESLTATARSRMELNAQLRHALDAEEFEVYYQPQLALGSGQVSGVEALVRWRRSDGSMISPADFIPVAEETGLIEELGAWVLRTACRTVKAWFDAGVKPITLAVNVAARQFHPQRLPALVQEVLAETGLPAQWLELEITESSIMEQGNDALTLLNTLKALGIKLAIDDFGTGYSSLAYLKRFAVDKLKIDQSFVRDIPDDISDMEITSTIIAMARHMRLKVLAEGVETAAQRNFLHSQGCDEMQGYLFSRPVPALDCVALIRQSGG